MAESNGNGNGNGSLIVQLSKYGAASVIALYLVHSLVTDLSVGMKSLQSTMNEVLVVLKDIRENQESTSVSRQQKTLQ